MLKYCIVGGFVVVYLVNLVSEMIYTYYIRNLWERPHDKLDLKVLGNPKEKK